MKTRRNIGLTVFILRVLCFRQISYCQSVKYSMIQDHRKLRENRALQCAVTEMKSYNFDYLGDHLWLINTALYWGGTKINYYNQAYDKNTEERPNTMNGWCLGASIRWLYCKSANQDFWLGDGGIKQEHVQNIRNTMTKQTLLRTQSMYTSGSGSIIERFDPAIKKFAPLREQAVHKKDGAASINSMAQQIGYLVANAYVMIAQYYSDGGGHAMAAFLNPSGQIFFMDPNLGEIKFGSRAQFHPWFNEFIRFQRYDITEFYIYGYRKRT